MEAGPGGRYQGGPVADGGSIRGTVTIDPVPGRAAMVVGEDAPACAGARVSPRLVVDTATKGVLNIVVFLDTIAKGTPLPTGVSAVIDHRDPIQHRRPVTVRPGAVTTSHWTIESR